MGHLFFSELGWGTTGCHGKCCFRLMYVEWYAFVIGCLFGWCDMCCMCFMFVLICALFIVLEFVLISVVKFVLLKVVVS